MNPVYPKRFSVKDQQRYTRQRVVVNSTPADRYKNYVLMLNLYVITQKEAAAAKTLKYEFVPAAVETESSPIYYIASFFKQLKYALNLLLNINYRAFLPVKVSKH